MSHAYRRSSPSAPETQSTTSGPQAEQDPVGNAARAEAVESPEAEESWFSEMVQAEEEEPKGPAGPSRPDVIPKGAKGALIGDGSDIEVRDRATTKGSVTATLPDGTPCKVVKYWRDWIHVEFREGTKKAKGWVKRDLFSDQPAIAPDDDNPDLMQDYTFTRVDAPMITDDLSGTDVEQGYLGDCFFISAMNAVGNANPDFLEESVKYDAAADMYSVRFYEEAGMDPDTGQVLFDELWIDVDPYIPTKGSSSSGVYASAAAGKAQWGAIIEKAYAKWKGGYDVLNEGGYEDVAMEELTGARASAMDPQSMDADEVIPFFKKADETGLAVSCGTFASKSMEVQTPLAGSGEGPYSGKLKQIHDWNHPLPGTVHIVDTEANVAPAHDTGTKEEDKKSAIKGDDVKTGEIVYEEDHLALTYKAGKKPAKPGDLEVSGEFHGMLYPAKQVIGNHAYSFDKLVGEDTIQLYNPWGSYQPKPLTAAEFLEYYSSLSSVQVPQAKGQS